MKYPFRYHILCASGYNKQYTIMYSDYNTIYNSCMRSKGQAVIRLDITLSKLYESLYL